MPVAEPSLTIPAASLDEVRGWVGDTPSDIDIDALWVQLGGVELVALRVLRKRRATMLANPTSFNVQGDYSQSTVANLQYLDSLIVQLEQMTGTGHVVTAGHLVRVGSSRRLPAHRWWR